MMNCILYARFSPRPGSKECDSCDRQLADLRDWVAKHPGYKIMGEYRDDAVSGELKNDLPPPGLCDAISQLRRGWTLLIRDVSRACRSVLLLAEVERRVKSHGARIYTLVEKATWDSPQDKFLYTIFGAFAEYQRSFQREITRAKMRMHQKSGRVMSSLPPYGWRIKVDGKRKVLVPDETEQANLRLIMKLRKDGLSIRKVIKELHKRGIYARNGKRWLYSVLHYILTRIKRGDQPDESKFTGLDGYSASGESFTNWGVGVDEGQQGATGGSVDPIERRQGEDRAINRSSNGSA